MSCHMQAVSEYEHKQHLLMGKEASALRQQSHTLAVLPQLLDSLRALFGLTGPSTRPLEQVCCSVHPPKLHCCHRVTSMLHIVTSSGRVTFLAPPTWAMPYAAKSCSKCVSKLVCWQMLMFWRHS